ncbi:hypothetical protein Dimus_022115 [Dionaea muscipula]
MATRSRVKLPTLPIFIWSYGKAARQLLSRRCCCMECGDEASSWLYAITACMLKSAAARWSVCHASAARVGRSSSCIHCPTKGVLGCSPCSPWLAAREGDARCSPLSRLLIGWKLKPLAGGKLPLLAHHSSCSSSHCSPELLLVQVLHWPPTPAARQGEVHCSPMLLEVPATLQLLPAQEDELLA